MVVQKPERSVVFKKRIGSRFSAQAEQERTEFSEFHRSGCLSFFDQTGLETPVLDAFDHVLADAESHDGIGGEKTAGRFANKSDAFLEPSIPNGKRLMAREPKSICILGHLFVQDERTGFWRSWRLDGHSEKASLETAA
jgi:hypothetical protein